MGYDNHIVEAVRDTLVQAGSTFRDDQKRAYRRAIGLEVNDTAKWTLETILENAEIAERNRSPLCDDTGIPHLLLELGPVTLPLAIPVGLVIALAAAGLCAAWDRLRRRTRKHKAG